MNRKQKIWWMGKTVLYTIAWGTLFYFVPWYARIFMIIWFGGLFFQSAFFHRYSAHQVYKMSHPALEKVAFVGAYIFQGSSYLSAYTYGLLHRIHHAFTDTEHDPHSPTIDQNGAAMMRRTARMYNILFRFESYNGKPVEEKFKKNLPTWHSFDRFAHGWLSRLLWVSAYITTYGLVAYHVDDVMHVWEWAIVFVLFITSCFMGPFHGYIVNWWGHQVGYRNFNTKDLSRNIGKWIFSIPMNFIMMGEDLHNNHHAREGSPNFARKWWEYDFIYTLLWCMDRVKIIRLKTVSLGVSHRFFG